MVVTMPLLTLGSVFLGLAFLYFVKIVLLRKKTLALLPPGPKLKPIIGNLRDLPRPGQQEWTHWLKFKELYGMLSLFHTTGAQSDKCFRQAQSVLCQCLAKQSSSLMTARRHLTSWKSAPLYTPLDLDWSLPRKCEYTPSYG